MNGIKDIKDGMLKAGYICDDRTATVIYLAQALHKPLLVEGPAGVGKTAIAQAFSRMKGLSLIRLQCYEGIDESKAMYEWNYKRQLLHIQAVANQTIDTQQLEQDIFSEDYLLSRPLLKAINSVTPVVLLIDEIDKVDFEFEAMLLEVLSEYQMTIPEMGTIVATTIPFVFLTSNATRELSEALKRRCLYLYLDFPSSEVEEEILRVKLPDISVLMAGKIAYVANRIRQVELKKPPSIAETIDWASALIQLGINDLNEEAALQTLNVFIKHREDIQKLEGMIITRKDLNFQARPGNRGW
jgi:MoxR-like ATPase